MTAGKMERLYAAAVAHYRHGRYAAGLLLFQGLLRLDLTQARFFKGCGACLQRLGRHQAAAMQYAAVYALDDSDPSPLLHLAECFAAVGAGQETREAAQEFLNASQARAGEFELPRQRASYLLNQMEADHGH